MDFISWDDCNSTTKAVLLFTPLSYGVQKIASEIYTDSPITSKFLSAATYLTTPLDRAVQLVAIPVFAVITHVREVRADEEFDWNLHSVKVIVLSFLVMIPKVIAQTCYIGAFILADGIVNIIPFKAFSAFTTDNSSSDFMKMREWVRRYPMEEEWNGLKSPLTLLWNWMTVPNATLDNAIVGGVVAPQPVEPVIKEAYDSDVFMFKIVQILLLYTVGERKKLWPHDFFLVNCNTLITRMKDNSIEESEVPLWMKDQSAFLEHYKNGGVKNLNQVISNEHQENLKNSFWTLYFLLIGKKISTTTLL